MDQTTAADQLTEPLRLLLSTFEVRTPTDTAKIDDELVHDTCGEVLCDVDHGDTLSTLAGMALEHTCPERITLTLLNRPEVIAFIDGEFHPAREPDDLGSDVVVIDLIDRSVVVILGETVTRAHDEFRIGRGDNVRATFPRIRQTPEGM